MRPQLSAALLLTSLPALAAAQSPVRVNGLAWDSLSNRALASAFVSLGTRSTVSDSAGRFSFDSILPGTHRATMQHEVLDSLGLSEIVASVVVRRPDETIRLATPSSRTMWRRVCPGEQPRDSGFVFGIVRDAARQPVVGASIVANWIELVSVGRGVVQKGWKLETTTTADGSYVMCGMPVGTGASLEATRDSTAYAGIEVFLTDRGSVRRQDLTVSNLQDSTARGTIRGTVTADGTPVSNVRIEIDGLHEVTTGNDGGFVLRGVRAGTRQLYVQGIGFTPMMRIVEVTSGDTAQVSITVGRTTMLDSVRVVAPTARTRLADQFNERRRVGVGYHRDSIQIGKFLSFEGVFSSMPSVVMERPRGQPMAIRIGGTRSRGIHTGGCIALIYIDGMRSDAAHLGSLYPRDLAAIEVYRTGEMPGDLLTQFGLNPFTKPCAIVAWTKLGWQR
jgi:hypothetical protein